VKPYITEMAQCGDEFEKTMREYQRFGTQLREIVEMNLKNLTTELHLLEKIKKISEPDPDERDKKVIDTVFTYYTSLDKIFGLFVDKNEILKQKRLVRPYILDKYYLELEARIVQLIERARLMVLNPDKISEQELLHDIKEFYQRYFFSNLHLFICIVYKE
jgi:hypothetical protein